MTGIWHAVGKQSITGDPCYVILNGLKESHLLVYPLHVLEGIQVEHTIILYTFFASVQSQMLRDQKTATEISIIVG